MAIRPALILEDGLKRQMSPGDLLPVANIPEMGAASAGAGGTAGAVPPSAPGDQDKVLTAGKIWVTPSSGGGSGTVTTLSVATANGFAGTVATPTTTPVITLSTSISGILQGNGTAISAAATTGTGSVVKATAPTLSAPVVTGGLVVDTNAFYVNPITGAVGVNTNTPTGLMMLKGSGSPAVVSPTNMTTDSLPTPFVALASGTSYSTAAWMAFDGSDVSYFVVTPSPCWLQIDLNTGYSATQYVVRSFRDAGLGTPKIFSLQGSNDGGAGGTWVTVDGPRTLTATTDYDENINNAASYHPGEKTFTITSPGSYRFYRINVTEAFTNSYTHIVQLRVLAPVGVDHAFTATGLGVGITPAYPLDIAGQARSSQSTFVVASEPAVKSIVGPHPEALPTILALNPIEFTWTRNYRSTTAVETGFDASEVQALVPNAVTTLVQQKWANPDAVATGKVFIPPTADPEVPYQLLATDVTEAHFTANNGVGQDYEGATWEETTPAGTDVQNGFRILNPSFLLPMLVKAVQELKAEKDALEARVAALEAP